jgi:hypothetical protein
MVTKIISGGQTGADLGGLWGARDAGFPTGGFAPKGYLTEIGPEVAPLQEFGLVDSGLDYVGRTELNAKHSDVTIWFGHSDTAGWIATQRSAKKHKKLFMDVTNWSPEKIAKFISPYRIINVAGNRESLNHGIFEKTRHTIKLSLDIVKTLDNDLKLQDDRK